VIGNQVLPDGHGIPAPTESLLDQCAIRLAGTADLILLGSSSSRPRIIAAETGCYSLGAALTLTSLRQLNDPLLNESEDPALDLHYYAGIGSLLEREIPSFRIRE
jgi:hypothetical protein